MIDLSVRVSAGNGNSVSEDSRNLNEGTIHEMWAQLRETKKELKGTRSW